MLLYLRREAQGTAETSSTQPVDRIELYLEGAGKQEEEAASSALSAAVSERLFLSACVVRLPSASSTGTRGRLELTQIT